MAKTRTGPFSLVINLAVWLTGVLVSLAVGFGMIDQVLIVRWLTPVVTVIAGWIVIILTLVSVILAIVDKLK